MAQQAEVIGLETPRKRLDAIQDKERELMEAAVAAGKTEAEARKIGREKAWGRRLYVAKVVSDRLHLVYRRRNDNVAGTWLIRRFDPTSEKFPYSIETVAVADDLEPADGERVLTFRQVDDKARLASVTEPTPGVRTLALTVREAVEFYIAGRDARDTERLGRPVTSDASGRLRRYVLGQKKRGRTEGAPPAPLASVRLNALDADDLKAWRAALPAHLKKSSVTRLCNDLKAALNDAYDDNRRHLPPRLPEEIRAGFRQKRSRTTTQRTVPEAQTSKVRGNQILSSEQVGRLLAAAREIDDEGGWEGDLFRMVLVLAATGTRFSQAARIAVGDCDLDASLVMVPVSFKGNVEQEKEITHTRVPVGADVVAALRPAVAGRSPGDRMLERWLSRQIGPAEWERTTRGPWKTSTELTRPWALIRGRAEMPTVIPYALRHSSIVRGLNSSLPVMTVAKLHDTSAAVIERHYAAYIADASDRLLREAVVPLVPAVRGENVTPIRGRG